MNAEQVAEVLMRLTQGQEALQQVIQQQATARQANQARQEEESRMLRELQQAQLQTLQLWRKGETSQIPGWVVRWMAFLVKKRIG